MICTRSPSAVENSAVSGSSKFTARPRTSRTNAAIASYRSVGTPIQRILSTRTAYLYPTFGVLKRRGTKSRTGGLERLGARRREGVLRTGGLRCAPPLAQPRRSWIRRLSESAVAGAERRVRTTASAARRRSLRNRWTVPRFNVTTTPVVAFGRTEKRALP